jgi:3-hydroxy-9,10-secoandrosta-1,3,5(10)-triene-9,17-dione monooxygenase
MSATQAQAATPGPAEAGQGGNPDYARLLQAARDLVPALRERAGATEELRRLPPETEADLHRSGLFRILQPKRVGGLEFDYVALIDFAAELARGDASVAWTLNNLASHHWMLAMFPEKAQDTIWNDNPETLIASSFVFPAGKAERAEGGYRITGRWPFSSGVDPSTWNMLGGVVAPDDELHAPEFRIFLVPQQDYEIIDTWFSSGLKGTGSKDVEAKDIFVPEHMTLAVKDIAGGPTPGSDRNPNALYKLPVFALFPFVLTGCALGNARGCLEDFVESMRHRVSKYNQARLADFQSIQIKISEAGARIDAARRIMRSICTEAMEDARAGRVPDLVAKTRYRRDGAYSVGLCTEAVDILFGASGAGGLYSEGALQRQFRDAHAIQAHIAFNFDAAGANNGKVELGFPSDNPTL